MSRWLAQLRVALRSLIHRRRLDDELDEEMQYHLEQQIAEGLHAGLTPDEARYAALRVMGAIGVSKEESRDLRSGRLLSDFSGDLTYAARALGRSPGFALLAIAVMAVGIGANTAVFSVVNGVLLKPLPYPGAARIVALSTAFVNTGGSEPLVTIANFRDWRDQSSAFEAMSSYRPGETSVSTGTTAEYGRTASVDAQFFRVLGVEPIIGRTFTPEEVGPAAPAQVLVSYSYWQSRFAGSARVLEQTVRVGNGRRAIIGVLPAGFQFPNQTDVWLPQTTQSTSRTGHNFYAVGRIKPGVSLEQAQAELSTIAARLAQQYPESNKGRGVVARRLQDELAGDARLTLYLLWGVVGLVLLIACANTATLLLGKASVRSREMAVRAALGASRFRIVRQLITEALVLALAAGASGMLLAYWGSRALVAIAPFDVVRSVDTAVDVGVLSFTLAISLATSVLFGLIPALHASKVSLIDTLKQAGRAVTVARGARTRGLLVVSEIALAVVLLTGAGLLMKSLVALHNVEMGFQPENVLVMRATGVRSTKEHNAFINAILSRLRVLPGIVAAGATSTPPGDLSLAGSGSYFVDRMPQTRDRTIEPQTLMTFVAPDTFAALGIPLKSGRDFDDGDSAGRPMVAIVNEALVRKSFAGENPLGRTIFCNFIGQVPLTIVGVVGDVRQHNPATAPMPDCYMSYQQHNYNSNTLNVVVRTAGDPTLLAGTLRRAASEISPDVPVAFTTMEETMAKRVEDPTFRAVLFAAFAGLAVCLAMAGVYGVMAYSVEQRSNEIGLRVALGASKSSVLKLILGQGLQLGVIGLALGLAGAVAATRLLTTVLFEVQPLDIPVYASVAGLLILVTLVAGYLPARRAATVDPVEILRTN